MCGINGILRLDSAAPPVDGDVLVRTRDAMARRGPDGHGAWIAADGAVGLGHRRLAIIDLSPTGAQPMAFDGGRFRMVFNGEIFNYRELRAELAAAGQSFVSTSDSEVILALYAREGTAMLARLRGMYTIALWDERKKALLLARDPYGIKPLYYAESGGHLHFASQVRALEASGAVPRDLDPAGLVGFLLWGSVPQPYTLRRRIRALPAGHHLFVRAGRVGSRFRIGRSRDSKTRRPAPSGSRTRSKTACARISSPTFRSRCSSRPGSIRAWSRRWPDGGRPAP